MADQKLSALSAIPTSDINNNTLLYVVDTVGTDTSYQVTRSALYLAVANTWTAQQTITVVASTALVINIPTGPTGGSTKFIGALSVVAQTVAFATTAQTGDYVTNEIGQATLTNPAAGTITNAASLAIDGAPVASTNVTITNARSLWVKSGLSEFDGGITSTVTANTFGISTFTGNVTMSGANIALGTNLLLYSTVFQIQYQPSGGFQDSIQFIPQSSQTNKGIALSLTPNGTTTLSNFFIFRTSDFTTNYESLTFGSDNTATGEFAINVTKGGTGSLRPINIYMSNTKLMSFDVARTVSFYTTLALYNNIATAGKGIPAIYGTVGLGVSLNTTSTTITSYTPATTGFFSVRIAISCKTSSTVTLTISYTDPQAGTITNEQIYSKALTGGNTDSLTFNVYASTATAITVSGTDSVALGDAYASAQVEQLQ